MTSALTDSSNLMPAVTASFDHQPPRQKIRILPAIPRKLERKPNNSSERTNISRSVTRTHAEQLPQAQNLRTDESLQNNIHGYELPQNKEQAPGLECAGTAAIDPGTHSDSEIADGSQEAHPAHPEPMVAADASTSSILDPLSPCFVPHPANVTSYYREPISYSSPTTPTETVEATSSSVSDQRNSHPVPTTMTSPETSMDMAVDGHDKTADSVERTSPDFSYRIPTTTPWIPLQTTPPEDSGYSPTQQTYPTYFPAPPYDSQPALNIPTSGVDYGYIYPHPPQFSYYQQPSQTHPRGSTVQSSYEGYTIGHSSPVFYPQTDSPSRQRHSISTSTPDNRSKYTPVRHQSHHGQVMPQFGSHLPITPSATPSNSGSQTQRSLPKEKPQPSMPTEQPEATPSSGQDYHSTDLSTDFKERREESLRILHETTDTSTCPYALANHLLDSFNDPAFADCELYITHVDHRFEPSVVSLHSLLIAQNPVLRGLLQSAEFREDGKKQVLLKVRDQYADPAAIKCGLKVCYGERPAKQTAYPGELASESEISTAWMENALALAAAGHALDMVGLAHRGEQIASMIIDWHNVERALEFAMDSDVQRIWGSSNGSSEFPSNAGELLLSCLYFVIGNVSENICLDLVAKSLPTIDRLPLSPVSPPQTTKSRLSRIQFGQLPTEREESTGKHDSLASSILLSLAFPHLKFILDRVPLAANQEIIKPLVEERERRRLRIFNAQTDATQTTEGTDSTLTQQERVIVNDNEEEGRLTVERS
ncbi:MAG: hypothetical protein LQ350_004171 [Teloschistes chrysophthalmus]|nr:MAG: hypothetical protein LQ350_004171 [Niorma chrysophthalma]